MTLDVVVAVKVVPKPEEVSFNKETKTLDRAKAENVLNPSDKCAIEAALRLAQRHGGDVSVVSMGPPFAKAQLDLAIGMGATRAILASDRLFAGSDTYPTSRVLAAAIRLTGKWDVVLCGDEAADSATGQVPQGIAEWLGIPQVTFADRIDYEGGRLVLRRPVGRTIERASAPVPALVSLVAGAYEPRFPDFTRVTGSEKENTVEVVGAAQLGLREEEVGLKGSFTTVAGLVEGEAKARRRRLVEGSMEEKARAVADAIRASMGRAPRT
ncbi:MAG: electron transfer flavoprotein subunit beta/FixA family protein [Euryarchaeota archaeon]|nr:electron transfer flavoprotein subunit beta/FixA family protein [Euryarchaeota archaeon]